MKKILVFGTNNISKKVYSTILRNNIAEISGIVSLPQDIKVPYSEKKVHNVQYTDITEFADKNNIPVIYSDGNLNNIKEKIMELAADLFLVIGWYHKIPSSIRNIAPIGCFGFHASLLPKYRGGAPLVWAIINGETETGVSLFEFTDEIDAGDIISQQKFEISSSDTIADLLNKTEESIINIVKNDLPGLLNGTAKRIEQKDEESTIFLQRSPEDGEIDWTWNSKKIKDFVRAQTKPYPGAFTIFGDKKITIWDADIEEL